MATIVLGAQFGDEGKGKLVDILCANAQLCVRCAGGNNAGHTIKAKGVSYDFHMLPSGLVHPSCTNFLAEGVVIHIPSFFNELDIVNSKGLTTASSRIFVSNRAHVVCDLHQYIDGLEEEELGAKAVGTTKKGIGPAYSTKAARSGVPVWEVLDKARFDIKLRRLADGWEKRFGKEKMSGYSVEKEIEKMNGLRERLEPFVVDGVRWIKEKEKEAAGKEGAILVEGANALMLDISFACFGGAYAGTALSHALPKQVIGVVKAYTTRVGAGPLPTEELLPDGSYGDVSRTLQEVGREWGVTTGRRRRTGWLDLVIVKYSQAVNGYTAINFTKLDVLDGFENVKVAIAYKIDGELVDWFPADISQLERAEVVYETLPGWQTSTVGVTEWEKLPPNARNYIERVESYLGGVKCKYIGTGPDRDNLIVR